jgi:hypothetical protein
MSKMADMAQTIEDLHRAAAAINDAAEWLATSSFLVRMNLSSRVLKVHPPRRMNRT